MGLKIIVGLVQRLPNSIQVRLAIGTARYAILLCSQRRYSHGHYDRDNGYALKFAMDFSH
jgi:hypothetical protein